MSFSVNAPMAIAAKLSGIVGIVREALILPSRNWRLILYVFLISVLVSSTLNLACFRFIYPLVMDLTAKSVFIRSVNPESPLYTTLLTAILKDIQLLLVVLLVFAVVGFLATAVTKTITIYAFAVTHTKQVLTLGELFGKIKLTLGGSLITQSLIVFLYLVYAFFWAIVILLLQPLLSKGVVAKALILVFVSVSLIISSFYLTMLCALSATISVVEKGCYGVRAIKRGKELFQGNKMRGILILALASVLAVALSWASNLASDHLSGALWTLSAMLFVRTAVLEVVNLFILVVITVYYYECRRSHGEVIAFLAEAVASEGGRGVAYSSLAAYDDARVDAEKLP